MQSNIILLGATGSIGQQVLDVIRNNPDRYNLLAFSSGKNKVLTEKILKEFSPSAFYMIDKEDVESILTDIPGFYGEQGLLDLAKYNGATLVINALMGSVGLLPTIEAIKSGINIGLANKETLVCAGDIIMSMAKEYNVSILPIDSEHNAIKHCISNRSHLDIKKIIITASGGSFRDLSRDELKNVTLKDALNHPNWSMGKKITIDSATMMNKGLEVIEAYHLFDVDINQIDTVLHKQSIIHSLVQFKDTSYIAHMGCNDMRIPIQSVMSYPDYHELSNPKEFDLLSVTELNFKKMDYDRFPCLKYAYDAIKIGGIIPCVLNASNEAAVQLFLDNKISFLDIENIVYEYTFNYKNIVNPSLEDIIRVDKEVKTTIFQKYEVI